MIPIIFNEIITTELRVKIRDMNTSFDLIDKQTVVATDENKLTLEEVLPQKHQPGFFERLFFGPHIVEGAEMDDEETEAVIQQVVGWTHME